MRRRVRDAIGIGCVCVRHDAVGLHRTPSVRIFTEYEWRIAIYIWTNIGWMNDETRVPNVNYANAAWHRDPLRIANGLYTYLIMTLFVSLSMHISIWIHTYIGCLFLSNVCVVFVILLSAVHCLHFAFWWFYKKGKDDLHFRCKWWSPCTVAGFIHNYMHFHESKQINNNVQRKIDSASVGTLADFRVAVDWHWFA